jgi:hypothetical protein
LIGSPKYCFATPTNEDPRNKTTDTR